MRVQLRDQSWVRCRGCELLCVCDRSWGGGGVTTFARDRLWLRFFGWPSCFACTIDRGFVATDGRGLVA